MASPLDAARRTKDKSYKHVFKGSVLINTLMEYNNNRFAQRSAAVEFGQSLLDMHHIESIVGSRVFEDGVSLYRWCDESVVQQAKKMVTTTSSHIPKKRLIELLDMEHGDGADGYDMREVQERVVNKLDRTLHEPESTQREPRQIGRLTKKDLEFAQRADAEVNGATDYTTESTLANFKSDSVDSTTSSSAPMYHEQSSTDDYTSTSDNNVTSQSDSAEADSPIDLAITDSNPVFEDPQSDSVKYEFHKPSKFEDVEQFKHNLPVEDRESLLALENLTQECSSFSDNEKTLLEQMKKMQEDHQTIVLGYEDRLQELVKKINEMKDMAEKIQESQATTTETAPKQDDTSSTVPAAPALPGAPPAAPAAPAFGLFHPKVAQPNKPQVKPRVKMRPLFWNRILLNDKNTKAENTVWKRLTEPNIDLEEFEEIFGVDPAKQSNSTRSLHDAMSPTRSGNKLKTVKLLEDNRSRSIGIKLRSMHCQMDDIRDAVHRLHFDKLDEESLHSLYELRGTAEEISKIDAHLKEHRKRSSSLDQPEQFLYEVSRMAQFEERVECLYLRKKFNETLFNIDEQLNILHTACDSLRTNESLKTVLEVVLAFGNYMNGGTQRGQADGFDINILTRLKDVKSMDNVTNLLQFVIRVHTREHEEDAGQSCAKFHLPDPGVIQKAAVISIKDLGKELRQLQPQLKTHQKKAEKVYNSSEKSHVQPFKNKMEEFFLSAHVLLKRQATKFEEVKKAFEDILTYLSANSTTEEITSDAFFSIWAQFLIDYKRYWETEQKRIAKEMFAKIEQRKKERRQKVKRRNSIVEEGRENLKQKFAKMKQRSENAAPHTAMLIRSQSVSSIDTLSSQSTNSLERNSLERRKRNRKNIRDDDSVFADDEDVKSEVGTASDRRRRRNIEVQNGSTTRHKSSDQGGSESGVDSTPQRNLGKMPNLLNNLGDPNMKIKLYYRKKDESTSETKPEDSTSQEKSKPERQRHRFVPDAVPKTGESMIERLQLRRQRSSRASMEDQQTGEAGYESSHTVRASGSNDETDKESNALQERLMRRRNRYSVTDDGRGTIESSLAKTPARLRHSIAMLADSSTSQHAPCDIQIAASAKLRRSRTNLAEGISSAASNGTPDKQVTNSTSSVSSVSSVLRRSRANLSEDLSSKPTQKEQGENPATNGVTRGSLVGTLQRSRSNVTDGIRGKGLSRYNQELTTDSSVTSTSGVSIRRRASLVDNSTSDSKAEPMKNSTYLRRSRSHLPDDLQSEGRAGGVRSRPFSCDRRNDLLQARSRFGQSMESVRSVGSTGAESTSSVRTRTRPSLSTSDTRRKLPADPKPTSPDTKLPGDNISSWKNRMFDSIKDTVTSASAGITALAQKFDPTIGQGSPTDNAAKCDVNQNNPLVKNRNDAVTTPSDKTPRSRRHSSDLASKDIISVVGSTSVQERSRIFAQRSGSQETVCKNSVSGAGQSCDVSGGAERSRSLRAARSMDALYKPLSTSVSRVRDRLSSYETSHNSATPASLSNDTSVGRRLRSRAGSDLGLSRTLSSPTGQEESQSRDKEALLNRDYRDVLRKLGRTRDSEESAKA